MEKSLNQLQTITEELASCVEEYMRFSAEEEVFEKEYSRLKDIDNALRAAEEDFVNEGKHTMDIEMLKMKEPSEFMMRYAEQEEKMIDYHLRHTVHLYKKHLLYLRWGKALKKLSELLKDEAVYAEFISIL